MNNSIRSTDGFQMLNANYRHTTKRIEETMEKLSSGKRINQASDDSSGLAISTRMTSQIKGNEKAKQNVQDGINLIKTANDALQTITEQLQRMRELQIQRSNGTLSNSDKSAIQLEIDSLKQEINRIAKTTNFNRIPLLNNEIQQQTGGWTQQTSNVTSTLYSVAYGNGVYVTAGVNNILVSNDGENWRRPTSVTGLYTM